ncbi:glycosyltransferase [Radicibacter daui]|uniref:glycosyltransferase n=1 Tax=Radicibacter daui TaxID=3064829 RepID=UPI00404702CA
MILQISKWRNRGGGSAVARDLLGIEPETSRILYLESDQDQLAGPGRDEREMSFMRKDFAGTLAAVEELARRGPLLIHSHGRIAGYHARWHRLRLGKRVKVVHSYHGLASFRPLKLAVTLATESLFSLACDAVVADSASEMAALSPFPVFCRREIINPSYQPANIIDHRARPIRRIGFAARMDFPKLHDDLIRLIAAHNRRATTPLTLVLCGDGPRHDEIDALGRELLGKHFENMRFVDHMTDFHRNIDAFAMFSLYEGMPLALVDAMTCGLPCIATDVRGCRDAIEDGVTGLLVPVGDEAAGLGALKRIQDPQYAVQLGEAARLHSQRRHAPEEILRQHRDLYQSIGYIISADGGNSSNSITEKTLKSRGLAS